MTAGVNNHVFIDRGVPAGGSCSVPVYSALFRCRKTPPENGSSIILLQSKSKFILFFLVCHKELHKGRKGS